jgi:murein L,D-transpeptidase YafK
LRLISATIAMGLALALAGCDETRYRGAQRHNIPIPPQMHALMSEKGMNKHDPVLIRSFKKEAELEVWKMGRSGRYELLKTYPICRWSGQLGPKRREGDRQAPEGFYHITPAQMNPNSAFYLSFNMGYPNAFDRAHGRTGAHLMVHGACSSAGCYSMTDDQIAELYAVVREAHNGGQKAVQMQSFPFRMTPENLARHRYDTNIAFWRNLKEGSDKFEVARVEPKVSICSARYAFNRTEDCKADPAAAEIAEAAAAKARNDEAKVASLVAQGTQAIKLVYEDGDQHHQFKTVLMTAGADALDRKASWGSRAVGVSRPDAVASGPREVAIDRTGRPVQPATQVAEAPAAATPRVTPPVANQTAANQTATQRGASGRSAASTTASSTTASSTTAAPTTTQAATTDAASTGPSFMQRVLSFNPFAASTPEAQPADPVTVRENTTPRPTTAPVPPRRADAGQPQARATGVRVAAEPADSTPRN